MINNRWYIYQKERFPLAAHAPLVAAFSYSALCYSSLLRHTHHAPGWKPAIAGFLTSLFFFLQLRIADEFKDFGEDSQFRPYRPVPRGLVKLKELGIIASVAAIFQFLLALWLSPKLLLILIIPWSYLILMSNEFFVRKWLKAHPFHYLWSHMLIMPMIDFYITACDWMPSVAIPPSGLGWFLAISFFNGVSLEIGRKIRAPQDEEYGVETYTFLLGRRNATIAWISALAACAFCAFMAGIKITHALFVGLTLALLLIMAVCLGYLFIMKSITRHAKWIEAMSGVWTLFMYLSVGAIPRLISSF